MNQERRTHGATSSQMGRGGPVLISGREARVRRGEMPDDEHKEEQTPPEQPPTGGTETPPEPEGDEQEEQKKWDPERAMATIRKLREAERTLSKSLKESQAELKKFQDAEEKKRQEGLSELEKARETLASQQDALGRAEDELRGLRLEGAFYRKAEDLSVAFASPQAKADAFELALPELTGIDLADDKAGKEVEKILKSLQEGRAYLFSAAAPAAKGPGTPPRRPGQTQPAPKPTGQTEERVVINF